MLRTEKLNFINLITLLTITTHLDERSSDVAGRSHKSTDCKKYIKEKKLALVLFLGK